MQKAAAPLATDHPRIPVFAVGPDYALETALAYGERGYELLAMATEGIPKAAVRIADTLSRAWMKASGHPYYAEIAVLAGKSREPGLYYFNSHYEWGCTTAAKSTEGGGVRLMRAFDWRTPGLGRHLIAARIAGAAGPWVALTWPGYTGALHGMAPGRFAAALNQAPRRAPTGIAAVDWTLARGRILRARALTPVHLLRRVFERAASFAEAKTMLAQTPLSAPVIFTLAGVSAGEACVIEREEGSAHVIAAPQGAACANDWQQRALQERRIPGRLSDERLAKMQALGAADMDRDLPWAAWPIVNAETRLVMVADAREGRIIARGYEANGPATAVLDLSL
jgi:hypothetical protein